MKLHSLLALSAFFAVSTPTLLHAEVVDLTTTSGKTYHDCRIIKVDPDGVMFRYSSGGGKVLFKDLTKNWREHFGYDAEKAKAHEEKASADRKRARDIAQQQLREANRARQEAWTRQMENQALIALQNAPFQNNTAYATSGWNGLSDSLPYSQWDPVVNGRDYYQAGRCYSSSPTYYNTHHGLPYAGTRYFNTGCNTGGCNTNFFNNTLCTGFTPRPFFAVPGVGINYAPPVCGPVFHSFTGGVGFGH